MDPKTIIRFVDLCKTFRYHGGASRLDDGGDDEGAETFEVTEDEERLRPGETRTALQNINLSIQAGERVGVIGTNGSGKSTLLSIVAGMSHPTSGCVIGQGSLISLSDVSRPFNRKWNGLR